MIKHDMAVVQEVQGALEVVNVVSSDIMVLTPGEQSVSLTPVASSRIKELLSMGNRVAVPKGLNREITPSDIGVRKVQSDTEIEVVMGRSRLNDLFNETLLVGSIIIYHDFIDINNKLCAAGFFICNDNREEKYLEILERGDEDLITDLEKYLEAKDLLNILSWKTNKIKQFEEEVITLETPEEVAACSDKYYDIISDRTGDDVPVRFTDAFATKLLETTEII